MSDEPPGAGDKRPAQPIAAPPAPADVGIVAALPIEVGKLLAAFRDVRKYSNDLQTIVEGVIGGKIVVLILTGPGRKAARKGAELLWAGHRPRWMISAGFGGALDPVLARNDVLFADEIIDPERRVLTIDVVVHPDPASRSGTGRLLTVDRIVRTAAEKAELRDGYGAVAVDMESSAVAALCSERGVRFLSIRIVSDDATTDLPPEIVSIMGRSGGYRLGAALGAIWRRPGSLKDLWGLREHAMEAAERIGTVVPDVIAQLP